VSAVRGRLVIRRRDDGSIVVDVSLFRRGFYLFIAAVLIAGLYVSGTGANLISHFNVATAFYLGVTVLSLGVGGWNARTSVDCEQGLITQTTRLFGVRLRRRVYRKEDVHHLLLRRIVLFRGREHDSSKEEKPALLGVGGGKRFSRRELGRLFLVSQTGKMDMLDESSDVPELLKLAEAISGCSGLPVEIEEI